MRYCISHPSWTDEKNTYIKNKLPPLILQLADESFPMNLVDRLVDEHALEFVQMYVWGEEK